MTGGGRIHTARGGPPPVFDRGKGPECPGCDLDLRVWSSPSSAAQPPVALGWARWTARARWAGWAGWAARARWARWSERACTRACGLAVCVGGMARFSPIPHISPIPPIPPIQPIPPSPHAGVHVCALHAHSQPACSCARALAPRTHTANSHACVCAPRSQSSAPSKTKRVSSRLRCLPWHCTYRLHVLGGRPSWNVYSASGSDRLPNGTELIVNVSATNNRTRC